LAIPSQCSKAGLGEKKKKKGKPPISDIHIHFL